MTERQYALDGWSGTAQRPAGTDFGLDSSDYVHCSLV